jgi:hypothetical protein
LIRHDLAQDCTILLRLLWDRLLLEDNQFARQTIQHVLLKRPRSGFWREKMLSSFSSGWDKSEWREYSKTLSCIDELPLTIIRKAGLLQQCAKSASIISGFQVQRNDQTTDLTENELHTDYEPAISEFASRDDELRCLLEYGLHNLNPLEHFSVGRELAWRGDFKVLYSVIRSRLDPQRQQDIAALKLVLTDGLIEEMISLTQKRDQWLMNNHTKWCKTGSYQAVWNEICDSEEPRKIDEYSLSDELVSRLIEQGHKSNLPIHPVTVRRELCHICYQDTTRRRQSWSRRMYRYLESIYSNNDKD